MPPDASKRDRLRAEERHAQLLSLLARQTTASLADLQEATGASIATTRRDLVELAERGQIERTRGGARILAGTSSLDEEFGRRQHRNARAKGAIAQAAAALIPDGSSLFINDGSTALALAQEIRDRGLRLWVGTCALNVAELLATTGAVEVVVFGGSLRRSSFGTIGPLATDALAQLHADTAFIGCDGVDVEAGPCSNSIEDAEVARAMTANADRTIVIADSTKLANRGRRLIVPWSKVDRWVTDHVGPEVIVELDRLATAVTSSLA